MSILWSLQFERMSIVGDYQMGETIGEGTFGKVRRGIHLATQQPVAIKILEKKRIADKRDLQRVQREMTILHQIDHPNIVRLLELHQTVKCYYIITELVEGRELYQIINDEGPYKERQAGRLYCQLVDALAYLHQRGICHRDVKPQNIIISGNTLKLIDFGLSCHYEGNAKLKTSCGSPCYAAPQMLTKESYLPEKADVWAIGVTLYAMLSGRLPFEHENIKKLYELISKGEYQPIQGVTSSLRSILRAMIEVNPTLRISLQEIQCHVWAKPYLPVTLHMEEWNEKCVLMVAGRLGKTQKQVKQEVAKKTDWKSVALYHLLQLKLNEVNQQSKGIPAHTGPVHVACIFKSVQTARMFIQGILPTLEWLTETEAYSEEAHAIIKTLGPLFYVTFNQEGQERLRQTQKAKEQAKEELRRRVSIVEREEKDEKEEREEKDEKEEKGGNQEKQKGKQECKSQEEVSLYGQQSGETKGA